MIKLTISLFIFVLILTVSANSSEEVNNLKKTDRPDVVLFVPGAGSSGSQMGGIGVGEILGWIFLLGIIILVIIVDLEVKSGCRSIMLMEIQRIILMKI